jgi:hypothetical protein
MKIYEHDDPNSTEPRSHPWNVAELDPTQKYYNFRENPELIRTSLEDFGPWDGYTATEVFYRLLEWLNGPDSALESNDCAFRAPTTNINPQSTKRLECSGRLMILYRDLRVNTFPEFIRWLARASRHYLEGVDPNFKFGVVGTTIMQANFITLPPPETQSGQELQLSFWAWGDSEIEAMTNLERIFQNMDIALRGVSDEIRQSAKSASQLPN